MGQHTSETATQEPQERGSRAWNEAMAQKYDIDAYYAHANPLIRFVEQRRLRRIWALVESQASQRVVDIGSGGGHLLHGVSRGRRLGLDLSETLLGKARHRLGPGVPLVQANCHSLPFKGGTVDWITCSEVLEHVLEPQRAIDEMSRVLNSHGAAVLSVPNERLIDQLKAWLARLRIFGWLLNDRRTGYDMPEHTTEEWHLHCLGLPELLGYLKRGWVVERVCAVPGWWLPLRYVVRARPRQSAGTGPEGTGYLSMGTGPLGTDSRQSMK